MGQCDGSMVSSFTSALVEGVEVQISEANEEATRTIMYIDDCVNGLIKLMSSSYTRPINLAGDDVLSVKDLLNQLKTLVANPSNAIPWKAVEFWPDSGTRRPANAAAFVNLGWYPTVHARDGLKTTVLWYKEDKAKRLAAKDKEAEARVAAHREREEYVRRQTALNLDVEPDIPLLPLSGLFSSGGGGDSLRRYNASP